MIERPKPLFLVSNEPDICNVLIGSCGVLKPSSRRNAVSSKDFAKTASTVSPSRHKTTTTCIYYQKVYQVIFTGTAEHSGVNQEAILYVTRASVQTGSSRAAHQPQNQGNGNKTARPYVEVYLPAYQAHNTTLPPGRLAPLLLLLYYCTGCFNVSDE